MMFNVYITLLNTIIYELGHLFKGTYTKTVYDLAGDLNSYSENIYKNNIHGKCTICKHFYTWVRARKLFEIIFLQIS